MSAAMTFYPQAINTELPSMEVQGVNAFLKDVSVSEDAEKTIVSGFYRMEKSDKPLVYTYTYHEMIISDGTGKEVHAKVGDVFYFPKGSVITFQSPSYGVGFFCGQRKEGEA